jgi:hypothetical protein
VNRALKTVTAKRDQLLDSKDDELWMSGDLGSWCGLSRRQPPDAAKLSTYLGKLACDDDTDKAYMAQRLIGRVAPQFGAASEPNAFLEALKTCPAFGRLPDDVKSRLERAAKQDNENKEQIKRAIDRARLACAATAHTIAGWHIARGLAANSGAFVETFRRCPAFAHAPAHLEPTLLLAAVRKQRADIKAFARSNPPRTPDACPPRHSDRVSPP